MYKRQILLSVIHTEMPMEITIISNGGYTVQIAQTVQTATPNAPDLSGAFQLVEKSLFL